MPDTPSQPNFLIFVTDQHPWSWLGCAGHVVRTPNIDALAARGVRFTRAYTVHPLCMPTRATWFTGQTPRGHGVRCNGIPLRRDVPTITEALRQAGYATHSIGKIHLRPYWWHRSIPPDTIPPKEGENLHLWKEGILTQLPTPYYGIESADFMGPTPMASPSNYTQWLLEREPDGMRLMSREASTVRGAGRQSVWSSALPTELHYTRWMAECADRFLAQRAEDDRPFFLCWSAPDPHPPFTAPPPWSDMYAPEDMPDFIRREGELDDLPPHYRATYERGVPSAGCMAATNVPDENLRLARAMACAMISQVDDNIGRTLTALEAHGLAENTVVVFMSDHGQFLGDHWLCGMPACHLDTLVRVPCIWSAPSMQQGETSDALVSHLDFAPSILDLAGVPPLEGHAPPVPEAAQQCPVLPGYSIRPLLSGEADRVQDSVLIENDEDYMGARLRTLVTDDWHMTCYAGEPYGELFDLRNDPNQLHNLWNDPTRRAARAELQAQLQDKTALTDSVLPRRLGHA